VIVVDGAHSKGGYKGVAFIAVTQDANQQIFPLTVGVGSTENNEDWSWFMMQLREAFGWPDELLIILDQHKSICHAVRVVYLGAGHAFCYYHLRKQVMLYNKGAMHLFKTVARTYSRSEFKR